MIHYAFSNTNKDGNLKKKTMATQPPNQEHTCTLSLKTLLQLRNDKLEFIVASFEIK